MTTSDEATPAPSVATSLGTMFVSRLLDRHQIGQRQRASTVEAILGVSYQQARRRLADVTEWTIEELRAIANHFGESLESMVALEGDGDIPPATLVVGELRIRCFAVLGATAERGRTGELVAVEGPEQEGEVGARFSIVPSQHAMEKESFEVLKLVIVPSPGRRKRVAVMDDDRDLAQSIAGFMTESGYDAEAFFSQGSLLKAIEQSPFEAYVLDWLVNGHSSEKLIAEIRQRDQASPIVVLTGEMVRGNVAEQELAKLSHAHKFQYYEKPARTSVIKSAVEFGFAHLAQS